jgi:hypothetical protein
MLVKRGWKFRARCCRCERTPHRLDAVAGLGVGQIVIVLAGFALFWTPASAPFEAAQLERPANQDNRRDQVASWVAVFLSALFASPAIVLGILAARRVL